MRSKSLHILSSAPFPLRFASSAFALQGGEQGGQLPMCLQLPQGEFQKSTNITLSLGKAHLRLSTDITFISGEDLLLFVCN